MSKYLILQLSQSGIPIWRAWVCRDTRRACRWFQIRALAAPAPGADCLPAWGRSSGSVESEAWGSACWRGLGCAWREAGLASGLWWSESPEVCLEGSRRWLCGTRTYDNASMRTPTREHTYNRQGRRQTVYLTGETEALFIYTVDSCTKAPPLSPTNPPPHANYDVILTHLDIGVSVGPIENGQLHQLHFLQVVLPLGLHQSRAAQSA